MEELILAAPKIVGHREGPSIDNGHGELAFIKLAAAETGGQFSLGEVFVEPGAGVIPHMHALEDEVFIVRTGQFEVKIGDTTTVMKEGDVVWAPRNVPHAWTNYGSSTAHMYVLITGSNFDRFISRYFNAMQAGDVDGAFRIAEEHGLTMYPTGW